MTGDVAHLRFRPVTRGRWEDLERLFGDRGAYGGCWCMWWRIRHGEFRRQSVEGNRNAMKALVDGGRVPGILAYEGREPVGWCSVAPRETYEALNRSRTLGPVDDVPVWSVVCFFIAKPHRGGGMMGRLLDAAVDHTRRRGGRILEGYPVDPSGRRLSGGGQAYVGIVSAFQEAGFRRVAQQGRHHVMRRGVELDERDVIRRLRALADPSQLEGMARFGIATGRALGGIRLPTLREFAREIGVDYDLALGLWETGVHEARILATMIDDPALVTERQMETWAADFDSWDLCDQACGNLFDGTPFAHLKALEWSARQEEFVKRAAFALMAWSAVRLPEAADREFERFLPIIRRESTDERNYVKKAVSWALRQIGKRNVRLNRKAVEAAEWIGRLESKAARWVAADALKELTSEAVRRRLGM